MSGGGGGGGGGVMQCLIGYRSARASLTLLPSKPKEGAWDAGWPGLAWPGESLV